MKRNEKRGIAILVIVTIVIIGIIFFATRGKKEEEVKNTTENNAPVEEFVQVLEDGTKLNTSTKLNETKKVNGIEFGNIQLTMQNGQSLLIADVKNTTSTATELTVVDVTLLDKQGNTIVKVGGLIAPLEPGASTQFTTSMTLDYANAYDFKVEMK